MGSLSHAKIGFAAAPHGRTERGRKSEERCRRLAAIPPDPPRERRVRAELAICFVAVTKEIGGVSAKIDGDVIVYAAARRDTRPCCRKKGFPSFFAQTRLGVTVDGVKTI